MTRWTIAAICAGTFLGCGVVLSVLIAWLERLLRLRSPHTEDQEVPL